LILVFLVSARSKTKIQFNGREYTSLDEMPISVREEYDRAIHETAELHSGARLAANEALAAMFPTSIAVPVSETPEIKPKKVFLIVVVVSNFCRSCLFLAARLLRLKR
jgi:hypothetical protein